MDKLAYAYAAEITKADEQPDGTLMVYGKATGPDLDLDGQRCDPKWLKGAMPEWFKWGNIREQHGPIAAGVGVELHEKGEDWWVKAHIVDPGTVAKVNAGVLKGFSVGIKNGKIVKTIQVPNGIITKGDVVEVSLVDRPSNPTCSIEIAKSAGGSDLFPVGESGDVLPLFDEEADDDPQSVDEAVDKGAEADELVEDGEAETVGELRKGFIMDLLSGKNDKRDKNGKFASKGGETEAEKRRKARLAERAKRLAEREAKRKHNAQEDAAQAEALRDADRARRGGRAEEAASHLAVAAAHSRTPGHYRRVRHAQRETALAMREKGVEADVIKAFDDEIAELLADAPDLRLSAAEYRDAFEALKAADDDGMILKRHDEQDDIDGAHEVIGRIADLIISEATELKNGCLEEAADMSILLEAVRGLCRFIERERRQNDPAYAGDDGGSYSYAAQPEILKRFFGAQERREAADEGQAMPDGSFPIKDAASLADAIHLAGNAKDPAAARAYIKRRAKALGLEEKIPDTWKAASVGEIDSATVVDADEIRKAVTTATAPLEAEIATLRGDLEKVLATPRPGGPFVMSIAPAAATAPASDPRTSPSWWKAEAGKMTDPGVKAAYLAKAAELEGVTP